MVNRLQKNLNRLTRQEAQALARITQTIETGSLVGLDVKKLKGRDDVFRVRFGKYRLILKKADDHWNVLAVERRSDTTCK